MSDGVGAGSLMRMLKGVSRSFYLSIRILPARVRHPIALAYLLARASDTIADTRALPQKDRIRDLRRLDAAIADAQDCFTLDSLPDRMGCSPEEELLLKNISGILRHLSQNISSEERTEIQNVLHTIISGQILDLERFDQFPQTIRALQTTEELHDYTWRVAGVVGSFWTRISFLHHIFPPNENLQSIEKSGIQFGQGLQLVNILRDLPGDLKNFRCYLPAVEISAAGLTPDQLLAPENWDRLKPVYAKWLDLAENHLMAGWQYVLKVPRRYWMMRLACAWPVLIGLETIGMLRGENPLEAKRHKVTRGWIYRLMMVSFVCHFIPGMWQCLPRLSLSRRTLDRVRDQFSMK